MTPTRPLSDLVRDKKIETEVSQNATKHVFYTPGRSAQERQIRSVEIWVRDVCLGQGAFGTVYLEKCKEGKGQNDLRAVKEIRKRFAAGEELDYTRELEAIIKFSNPKHSHCFVHCDGWFETTESVFISMEYIRLGDLQNYLTRPLYESDAREITSQILEGLQIMHENDFVHRDLKPGNIMVVTKRPWFVKIADFGISKRRLEDVTALRTLQRGTFGFAAPEIFGFGADSKDGSYTPAVDMWSLGAVTYKILTGVSPFPDLAMEIMYATEKSEFPLASLREKAISEEGQNFILGLMARVPQDRLTAAAARGHDWLKGPGDEISDEHLTTIDASRQSPVGDSSSPEASGLWTFDDTETKYPITREKSTSPQKGVAYKAPYLEEGPAELDQSPNEPLPKDSGVLLREATIMKGSEREPSTALIVRSPAEEDDGMLPDNPVPDLPRRSSIEALSVSTSGPPTMAPFLGDSAKEASPSSPESPVDPYAVLIREAVNECSATFQVDRFIDVVENPERAVENENYYTTACLPLKTLLRSHPGLLISHGHVLSSEIDEKSDPDVRVMLRTAILEMIAPGRRYQRQAEIEDTRSSCSKGHHKHTVVRPGAVCCHCSACETDDKGTSSLTDCFECDQKAMTKATIKLGCLHRICHPCLKRKFELSVRMPISRNMPPRCCSEDPIPTNKEVRDLLSERFWRDWEERYLDPNAHVVRIWCPKTTCCAFVTFDRTSSQEPRCPRCRTWICPLCDRPSHPERSCAKRVRIVEPTAESSAEGRMGDNSKGTDRDRDRDRDRNHDRDRDRQNPSSGRKYTCYVGNRPLDDPDPRTVVKEVRHYGPEDVQYSTSRPSHRPSRSPDVHDWTGTRYQGPGDGPESRRRWETEDVQYGQYPLFKNPYRGGAESDRAGGSFYA